MRSSVNRTLAISKSTDSSQIASTRFAWVAANDDDSIARAASSRPRPTGFSSTRRN